MDYVAEQALKRGVPGITQAQIDRALVKTPLATTIGGQSMLYDAMQSGPGKFAVPFQRTPMDVAVGGGTEIIEALGGKPTRGALGSAGRRKQLTAGSAAAGAVAGEALDEDKLGLLKFALLASTLGRRATPFALGGAVTGGRNFARGMAPIPEIDPWRLVPTSTDDIALVRLLRQLSGQERR